MLHIFLRNAFWVVIKMHFRKGTFINYTSFFDGSADIWIGESCNIGMGCRFITGTHLIEDPNRRAGRGIAELINIGNGCWIGAGVTIFPGVTIGDGTVIGAGAVVTSNCKNNSVYAGVPAKIIRRIDYDASWHCVLRLSVRVILLVIVAMIMRQFVILEAMIYLMKFLKQSK